MLLLRVRLHGSRFIRSFLTDKFTDVPFIFFKTLRCYPQQTVASRIQTLLLVQVVSVRIVTLSRLLPDLCPSLLFEIGRVRRTLVVKEAQLLAPHNI